jgi:tRNA (guanine37-N1)-methyltransferase
MTFDIVTIFPAMIEQPLAAGVIGRAIERGLLDVRIRDLRDFTTDRHRVVDDVPYGGGPGMVLKADPLFRALDAIEADRGRPLTVVLTSPQGPRLTQETARRLSTAAHVVILCGRYEGVDERVRERVTEELSIGDYVLTGGELPALVILDAVARLVPGVVGDDQSIVDDSFSRGLLDYPQYTRPATLAGSSGEERCAGDGQSAGEGQAAGAGRKAATDLTVPGVLLSGNHAEIRRWRKREAVMRTLDRRPDLLADASLDDEEREILRELVEGRQKS